MGSFKQAIPQTVPYKEEMSGARGSFLLPDDDDLRSQVNENNALLMDILAALKQIQLQIAK